MYFWQKHVENGPNCLHELATFLKYYMSLIFSYKVFNMLILVSGNCETCNRINVRFWVTKVLCSYMLSKCESVKFSLIESVIFLFTDLSVKKIFFTAKSVNFH